MEPVTPNPDFCRGLQAPLLLIKISKDFEKETIRLEGLRRSQMLGGGGEWEDKAFIPIGSAGCRVK